ncbi:DUF6571 family protein [Streptomyces reniochalinae]|uniref:DUF6571 domain-containing protein n=1 Tax=Streptomyces reniochalinae TaxID=2250578 RepID=A0A367ECQ5_9ACTN|nr:DUF6571 family protein [Streptomyces reniochalinae]RCG15010.1 hypothetical protein DQ392_28620 [Streptomyces reniochalinae]
MELTYHDIMNADFSSLTETAKNWRILRDRCDIFHDAYHGSVRKRLKGWSGESADAFWKSSKITAHEFAAAKKQAGKIADLLDDCHNRLTAAREHLKTVRDQAVHEGGMKVDAYGKCNLDTSGMTSGEAQSALRDPGRADEETKWNGRIRDAVKHVDDVDQENMLTLKAAATDEDGKGEDGGFNSEAVGDVEKYAGKRAAALIERLDSREQNGGLSPAERHELQVLLRTDPDDEQFSRTLLNSLRPDGLIDATNQLNALAYRVDKDNQGAYLGMEKSLATSLASATRVPVFRDGNGKKIKPSSLEYGKKYTSWLGSQDGAFYGKWREHMRKAGADEWSYTLRDAGGVGGSSYQGRGYQSLITLMKHGDGYSPQMLYDLGDDIRAAEEKHPDIWDHGGFDKGVSEGSLLPEMRNSTFENDPYDGLLRIMSKDPEIAAGYLDPASDADLSDDEVSKNDRMKYLVHDRDWEIVDTGRYDDHGKLDKDAREGFEAALKAGATGRLPDAVVTKDAPLHSAENAGVMEEAVRVFGGPAREGEVSPLAKGEDFTGFRGTLGEMIADYPGNVQREMYGDKELPVRGHVANFDAGALHETLNQVGRDPYGYGVVQASQQMYTVEHLQAVMRDLPHGADASDVRDYVGDAVVGGAYVNGVLSEARADALFDDKVAEARDFNEKADEASEWVNRFVGLGTGNLGGDGGGGALVSTPVGWAQEELSSAVVEHIKRDLPQEAAKGDVESKYNFTSTQESVRDFYRGWAENFGKDSGLRAEILEGAIAGARREAIAGFQDGAGTSRGHATVEPTE